MTLSKERALNKTFAKSNEETTIEYEKIISEKKNLQSECKALLDDKNELLIVQNNQIVLIQKLRGEITDLEFNVR